MILKISLLCLVIGSVLGSPITSTLDPANPTLITIQKSVSLEPSRKTRSNSEGWEPMVMHLLPKDSYLPSSRKSKATTEEPAATTTEEPSKTNDENDVEQETQGSSFSQAWTPLSAGAQYGLPSQYGQPAYFPSPAMFGLPVNNYAPPQLTYGSPVSSGHGLSYGAPGSSAHAVSYGAPAYPQVAKAELPAHYASQYASVPKEAAAVSYNAAQYGVPVKSSPYEAAPVGKYGVPADYESDAGKPVSGDYEGPVNAISSPDYESNYGAGPVKEGAATGYAPQAEYGLPQAPVAYGAPGPAYGGPVTSGYGAPHGHIEPVHVKKVVKTENLLHRHHHHKHLVHEHHLHKLHVHNHHLHRFHVHNHNLHREHVHVPIVHTDEKHETKETEEHRTKQTVGETHKHVHQEHEYYKQATPMYVVKPSHPGWSVWG